MEDILFRSGQYNELTTGQIMKGDWNVINELFHHTGHIK